MVRMLMMVIVVRLSNSNFWTLLVLQLSGFSSPRC
ncbi:hypothetical protein CASFOL_002231 [Castilleja foliolosa]|uniref:Uncharacterized protein n=1 Tax=Castilleja foliolosa TaxID=1961234 RepID=A0ABD3EDY8_9LAMI